MISIWLLALHMLGDYILQNDWMAANKFKSSKARTIHVFCYTIPFIPLSFAFAPSASFALYFVACVSISHWITDCRRWASGEKWCAKPIMVDQTIHLLTLAVLASIFLSVGS